MDVKKLTSLIIEPTNTCNLRCSFCFVTEGMTRRGGFIDFELFKKVINDVPWLEHLVLHNWGEPLLHPDLFRMIEYAGQRGIPHIVMNTNGTLLDDIHIQKIIDSPLSILRFSIDGGADTYERIRGIPLNNIRNHLLRLKNRKDVERPDLSLGVVFTVDEDTQSDVDAYLAEWEPLVDHVRLQPKLIRGRRQDICPEPFGLNYGKLVVLWDGTVLPCCVDYNATLSLGNAEQDNVAELWQSSALNALRRQHLEEAFPPACAECNECDTPRTARRFSFPATTPGFPR